MISFPVFRHAKSYIVGLYDSGNGSHMELIQTSDPAKAFDAQEILQAAFEKATAAALGASEAEKPRAPRKPRDPSAPPKLTKKRVAKLRDEYETDVAAGGDPEGVLTEIADKYGYDMKKLEKAFKKSWE